MIRARMSMFLLVDDWMVRRAARHLILKVIDIVEIAKSGLSCGN